MRDSLGGINEYKNLLTSFKDDSIETLDYADYQKRKIVDLQQASNWEDFRQFILDDTQQVFNPLPSSSPRMKSAAKTLKLPTEGLTPNGSTKNLNSKYRNGDTAKNEDSTKNGNTKTSEQIIKNGNTKKNGDVAKSVDTRKNGEPAKNTRTNNGNTGSLQVNTRYGHTLNVNVNPNVLNQAKLNKGDQKKRLLKPTKSVPSTPRLIIKKKAQMEIENEKVPSESPIKKKESGRGKWPRKPKNQEIEATKKNTIEKNREMIKWPSRFQIKIENEEKKEEEKETSDLPSMFAVKHEPEVKEEEFEEDHFAKYENNLFEIPKANENSKKEKKNPLKETNNNKKDKQIEGNSKPFVEPPKERGKIHQKNVDISEKRQKTVENQSELKNNKKTLIENLIKVIDFPNKNPDSKKPVLKGPTQTQNKNEGTKRVVVRKKVSPEPEPEMPEVKKNLKRKRSSKNIKNQPNLEKHSVLGKIDKDVPERIISHAIYDIANKTPPDRRLFLVAWRKRSSGEQPENSYCTGKDLKEKCPVILLSYYEEKATFV